MSPTLTYLAAHEHINDLLREAEQARRAGELTSSRRLKPRGARTGTSPTGYIPGTMRKSVQLGVRAEAAAVLLREAKHQ